MTKEEINSMITNPAHVIHLDEPEYYDIIILMFPQLTIDTELIHQDRFIVKHDVSSQTAMYNYKSYCRNFIIISNRLFDFNVSKNDILKLAIEWKRVNLGSRIRTLSFDDNAHSSLFDAVKGFMHSGQEEEQHNILELFDSVGTGAFSKVFLDQCKTTPPNVLIKSVTTFIKKATITTSSSVYYKRAHVRLSKKIETNLIPATRELCLTHSYSNEMDFINFHNHLFGLS